MMQTLAVEPVLEDRQLGTFDSATEQTECYNRAALEIVRLGLASTHCVERTWVTLPVLGKGTKPAFVRAVNLHVYTPSELAQFAADRALLDGEPLVGV